PMLITSCVLHYGIVYLRPFSAGNARMARLWQRRALMTHWPVFNFLPVEAFILRTEPAYHAALEYADRQGDCGGFITYMMEQIDEALQELLMAQRTVLRSGDRVPLFLEEKRLSRFTRKDYRRMYPEISTATASRDLAEAVREKLLVRSGEGRTAVYMTTK
ncbi:MAG TPA: Fic family protein, partial [Flavobacteriales bacterium]|nr:Fic family protein [Flavobacteriales bacterium]